MDPVNSTLTFGSEVIEQIASSSNNERSIPDLKPSDSRLDFFRAESLILIE